MESSTNSPMGSHHWYVTLLSFIKHAGEYLRDHGNPPPDGLLNSWGTTIVENTEELLYGFNSVEGFLSMHRYEVVNQCEDAVQLKAAILLIADPGGMIQGRKRSFKAARMAGFVEGVVKGELPPEVLTREYGIRQQALYIKFYEDQDKNNRPEVQGIVHQEASDLGHAQSPAES